MQFLAMPKPEKGCLLISYAVFFLDLFHAASGSWSGLASIANVFVVCALIPALAIISWRYRAARNVRSERAWWYMSIVFTPIFLAFWGIVLIVAIHMYG